MQSEGGSLVHRLAVAAGAFTALIGGGHVVAWVAGWIPQGPTNAIIMTTNAGLGLLAAGVALIITAAGGRDPRRRRIAQVCAGVALLLGLATGSEHLFGWNLGIDQLLATGLPGGAALTSPNRMGPPASLSLVLLGTALLLLTRRAFTGQRRAPALHEPFALAAALLGLLSTIGYLYGASGLYAIARLTGIAWPTALSILLLAVGVLCAEPDHGLMARVTAPDPGGAIIRALLGPMLVLPLAFGWLRLAGERLGWFDAPMGTGLTMLLVIVTFSSLLVFAGHRVSVASAALGASEREARRQKVLLEESEARLRVAQVAGRVGTFEWNVVSGVNTWSPELEAMYGLAAGDFKRTQRAWEDLLHPDDRAQAVHAVDEAFRTGEPGEAEFRVVWPDGSVHWLSGRWQVFKDASGQPLRLAGVNLDITDRKRVEEDLRESEERLRLAQDAGGVGIWEWDVRTNALHVTPQLERIYALEPGSVRTYADFGTRVHPDDLAMVETARDEAVAEHRPFAIEFRIVQPSGKTVWILSKGGAAYDADGAATRVFGVNVDITERKAADETLRRTEALLTAVSDTTEDAIYVKDRDSRLVMVNPATLRLVGKPLEEIVGHTDAEFYDDPAIGAAILEHDRELMRRGEAQVFEETVETPSGHRIMLSSKVPWRDADGRVIGIIGISRDITERKRAEQALADSEERYRGIVETAEEGIALHDADGTITYVNGRMATMLGYSRAELVGRSSVDFVADGEREAVLRSREALKEGRGYSRERRLLRKDGSSLWTLSNVAPRRDETGNFAGYLAMHTDISALKDTADALSEANARLQETDRRKDEFIAILSHELRNPLAPIRYALPALEKARLTDAGGEAIKVIERQVAHLTRLVDDLLDVSRITTGKIDLRRDHVTLRSVVRAAVEAAAPAVAAGGHSLTLHIPDEPIWVFGDAARLSQVITNLLDNSAKYTPRGGQLAVTVSRDGDHGIVSVRDNGVGIPAADLPTVFEMFHQVNRAEKAQGGLGIGLALVKRLVEMHGGSVEARSAGLTQGAEFVVQLPVAADVAAETAGVVPVPAAPKRLRVLVVDDNADLVAMLAMFVESFGHDVRKAFDGRSTVSAAVSYRPDVVLLDVGLPGMTGLDVARELRRRPETSTARLIALTGWGQVGDRQATQDAGFDAHLTKPAEPSVLETLLQCEGHQRVDCVDKCAVAAAGLTDSGGASLDREAVSKMSPKPR